jgi:hypothetical protein
MVAGSILPIAFHKNQLFFLFGCENPYEKDAPGWSDFGGGVEKGENPNDTAAREGAEELTGFLGCAQDIRKKLKGNTYRLSHNDYHVHIFLMEYDPTLPVHYNNNHSFLWDRLDESMKRKSKLFEKCEIKWFSEKELKKNKKKFRLFYQEILEKIRKEIPEIKKHFLQHRHTKKYKSKTKRTQKNFLSLL